MAAETRKKTIWVKLVEFHVNHPWLMLALITLGTIYFVYEMFGLKIHTDFFQLYPPRHPYIQLYKQYRNMFGTANVMSLMVEVKEGDIYNKATLTKVDNITRELLSTKGVNPMQVISITHPRLKDIRVGSNGIDVLPLMHPRIPETPLEVSILKKKVYTNDTIRGVWITPNDKATLLQAGFWEEGVDLGALWYRMMDIRKKTEDANTKIYITGYPMLYAWIAHYTPQLYSVFAVTAVVLVILLWWYFRSFMGVFIPMISMILSAVWGLGFAGALGFNIDPLILVVPILLSARALSHSVQSMERYHEEYAAIGEKKQAIINAYSYLYKPGILGNICDGLGVLTIAVATIPLMRNLAMYGCFWVLTIYVSSIVLHPVIVSLIPPPRAKHVDKEKLKGLDKETAREEIRLVTARPGDAIYLKVGHALIAITEGRKKWIVFGVSMAILIFGTYVTRAHLKVGDVSAGKAILYPDHEYNIAYDKVNKNFFGASQMIVIAEGKKDRAMVNSESLRLIDNMATGSLNIPAVGGAMTITDIVKRISRMYHDQHPKWGIVPTNPSHVGQMFFLIGGAMAPGELDRLITPNSYTNATVTIYFREHNNQVIKDAIAYLKDYIRDNPAQQMQFRLVGGILGILAAVNEEVEYSYWINMLLIFSTIFLFCWWAYRTWLGALVLWVPLLVCQVLCDIFMLVLGIDMNINSLPVASVGVGVGVDYGIYVLSRLAEEYQFSKGDFERARYLALTSTGKAIIFTASTLFVSIIFFAFMSFKFQAEMSILLAFLLIANMIGALALLPTLVSIIGPDRILPKYRV
jgi:uncharacterized protein